ncbi:hypothetical protein MMC30_004355 [Trapelia coarctata]|nr:hypothetical protein [Trapelia coarctata]
MSANTITSKRRRFISPLQQPSITNFLTPHGFTSISSSPAGSPSAISPSGLLSPSIPHQVQASLLQVGMRTRKAVSEGYKNAQKTLSAPTSAFIYDENPTPTTTSTTTMPPPLATTSNRKRALSISTSDISPTRDTSMSPPLRPLRQPQTRRRLAPAATACGAWDYDEAMLIDDFGEADFLKLEGERERRVVGGYGGWLSAM